jgi:hypothetical protein
MVYHSISPDMKRRGLQLLDEGWEMHEIAKILSVSSKSIERWHDNYERKGRVDPPSFLRGRRRILSAGAIADLRELIQVMILSLLYLWTGERAITFFLGGFFISPPCEAASLSSLPVPVVSGSSNSACNSCILRFAGPGVSKADIFLSSALDIS